MKALFSAPFLLTAFTSTITIFAATACKKDKPIKPSPDGPPAQNPTSPQTPNTGDGQPWTMGRLNCSGTTAYHPSDTINLKCVAEGLKSSKGLIAVPKPTFAVTSTTCSSRLISINSVTGDFAANAVPPDFTDCKISIEVVAPSIHCPNGGATCRLANLNLTSLWHGITLTGGSGGPGRSKGSITTASIALDSDDNALVAGSVVGGSVDLPKDLLGESQSDLSNAFIRKYDSEGNKLWTWQYGRGAVNVYARSIAANSTTGDSFICGSKSNGSNAELFLAKLNSSGVNLNFSTPEQLRRTSCESIALDSTGNILITGSTQVALPGSIQNGPKDTFIAKLDSSGQYLWSHQTGSPSQETIGHAIAVDSVGNAMIAGETTGNLDSNQLTGSKDAFVQKFGPSGELIWTQQLGAPSAITVAHGIAINSTGDAYITGYTSGYFDGSNSPISPPGEDVFLAKFVTSSDGDGVLEGSSQIAIYGKRLVGKGIAIGTNNMVFVTGSAGAGLTGQPLNGTVDSFTCSFGALNLRLVGCNQIGVASVATDGAGLAISSSGELLTAGTTEGGLNGNTAFGLTDAYLIKSQAAGNILWSQQLGVITRATSGDALATDTADNIYQAGTTSVGLNGNSLLGITDAFVSKRNAAGAIAWTAQLGSPDHTISATGLAIDQSGGILVSGLDFDPVSNIFGAFVAKYNEAGKKLWHTEISLDDKNVNPGKIATDLAGNIYLTGSTDGGLAGNPMIGIKDAYLVKLDPLGNILRTIQIGVSGAKTLGRDITIDLAGNAYMVGQTNGALDGLPKPPGTTLFLVKYNSAAEKQWTKNIVLASGRVSDGTAVTTDKAGHVIVGGFGPTARVGTTNLVVASFDHNGTQLWAQAIGVPQTDSRTTSVATDSAGNSFAGGWTKGALGDTQLTGNQDFFLAKFSAKGDRLWTKQMGATGRATLGQGLALDRAGNAFIGGTTSGNLGGAIASGSPDAFLAKYSPDGVLQ